MPCFKLMHATMFLKFYILVAFVTFHNISQDNDLGGVYMRPAWPHGLTLVVLALVYMRPALTVRLNYGGYFNGVKPAWNIQFGLAGDLRLGQYELNLRPDSCKQPTGKTLHPN